MKKEPIQVTPSWGNDKWSDPDSGSATSGALDAEACSPSDYDAGLLNDYGGGDVGWWQDYLRAEIGRANDYWRNQYITAHVVAVDAIRELDRILETGDTYCTREIVANLKDALTPGSFLHNASAQTRPPETPQDDT